MYFQCLCDVYFGSVLVFIALFFQCSCDVYFGLYLAFIALYFQPVFIMAKSKLRLSHTKRSSYIRMRQRMKAPAANESCQSAQSPPSVDDSICDVKPDSPGRDASQTPQVPDSPGRDASQTPQVPDSPGCDASRTPQVLFSW